MTTANPNDPNGPDSNPKEETSKSSPTSAALAEIESAIPTLLEALQVPGLTVSVFKDGQPLLHRGFGTRIMGRDDTPVNTDTLFDLCSVTKHITAAAVAKLVHDGKLKWTDPVTKHMPGWEFSDPTLTKSVTIVDLLSHRTGLASHNDMQMGNMSNLSAGHRDPAEYLPHLAVGDEFRSSYHYSNLCFALATRVIEQLSGQAFPDFVAEHLFDPLGIRDYEWCYRAFAKHPNAALPHVFKRYDSLDVYAKEVIYGPSESVEDRLAALKNVESADAGLELCKATPLDLETCQGFPEDQRDFVGAGVFYVSANDMVKWAQCLLNEGKAPDGTQVVHGLDVMAKVHNPCSYTPESLAPPHGPRSIGYGLGLSLNQFGAYEVWAHNGGMPGFITRLIVIPRAKTFIYIATNSITGLFASLSQWILHTLLPPAGDYPAAYGRDELFKELPKMKLAFPLQIAKGIKDLVGPVWPPAAPLAEATPALDYSGTYFHPGYGYVTVLADAHSGKLCLVRARNEFNCLHPVVETEHTFFTFAESPSTIRFVKDDGFVDGRPLPKRKGGVAWRPKVKYNLVMLEGSCDLDIVFKRVD